MDVFISYNWSIKEKVKELYQELINLNYKVWLDDNELNDNNLNNNNNNNETANGIKNSKIFISCITNDYCKCNSCNLEIEYALAKKKQIIALIIDNNIDTAKIDEIQIRKLKKYSIYSSITGTRTGCDFISVVSESFFLLEKVHGSFPFVNNYVKPPCTNP